MFEHSPKGVKQASTVPVEKAEAPRRQRVRPYLQNLALVITGILITFLVLFAYNLVGPGQPGITQNDINGVVARAMASATPPSSDASRIYQAVRPSVVLIETTGQNGSGDVENSRGTGVVFDQNGSIFTALHVVTNATQIRITFADGTKSRGTLVTAESKNDVAVIRALEPPANLAPAVLGNPRNAQVGDEAIVIGNPFGLSGSVTAGVISGLGRTFQSPDGNQSFNDLIQFDAAVNPGNSGGPLLDRNGEVIGIVTGLMNPTSENVFIGIGLAVPINLAAQGAGVPPY